MMSSSAFRPLVTATSAALLLSHAILSLGCGGSPSPTTPQPGVCPSGPIILNTGLYGSNTLLPIWDPDDDWQGRDPQGNYQGGNLLDSIVRGDPSCCDTLPNSGWIQPVVNANIGDWAYEYHFCLEDGFTNPNLSLDFLAADQATVSLNGNALFGPGGGGVTLPATHVATTDLSHFVVGDNTLTILVENQSLLNAILDVGGTVVADGPPQIDLDLSKTVDNANPEVGETIEFELVLWNHSNIDATGVTVSDTLPAGVTYGSDSGGGAYDNNTGVWTVGTITPYGAASVKIWASVDAGTVGTTITNTAEVIAADQSDLDSTPQNGVVSEDDHAAVSIDVAPTAPIVCGPGSTTLNTGLYGNATVLSIWDPDDDWLGRDDQGVWAGGALIGATVAGANPACCDTLANSAWIKPIINANIDHWEYQYHFCLDPGFTNPNLALELLARDQATVSLNGNLLFGPGGGPNLPATSVSTTDPTHFVVGNNVLTIFVENLSFLNAILDVGGTISFDGPPVIDLTLLKSIDNPTPEVGDTIEFEVVVWNYSAVTATGVTVADTLPAGVTYSADSRGGAYDPGTGVWTIGTIAPYGAINLKIWASVDAGTVGTTITNTAEVTAADQNDIDSTPSNADPAEDDLATASITVQASPPVVCGPGTTLLNTGLYGNNTVLSLWDPDDDWLGRDDQGVWAGGALIGATVAGANLACCDTLPNSAWLMPIINANIDHWEYQYHFCLDTGFTNPALSLDFLARDQATVSLNGNQLFGPGGGPNLPATHVSTIDPSHFVVGNNVLTIFVQNLSFLAALLDVGGTITVDGPPPIDLSLGKSVSDSTPQEGDTISYTLMLNNDSGVLATGIIVGDLLPVGVTYVSDSPLTGTYDPGAGEWSLPSLNPLTGTTLTIVVTVDSATLGTTITNAAEVFGADQDDVDSIPANGEPSEDDIAFVDILVSPPPDIDLDLTKSVSPSAPLEGATIIYTLQISNNSAFTATGVEVTDVLPAGVTFVSSVGSFGNYNGTTGVWSIASIGPYIYGTLIIYATVDAGTGGSTITNTAEITAVDQPDPDSTPGNGVTTEDDMASADIVVNVPIIDLELSKSVTPATANIGDTVMFDIVLTNASATPATGVTITDLLPTGVTVVSFGTSFGTWNPGSGAWTVPSLSPYTYGNLWIFATVDPGAAGSTLTNTAEVTAADQLDVDSTPNNGVTSEDDMASADLVVNVPIADLEISKSVAPAAPNEADTVAYSVVLTNASPITVTGVEVTDVLPAGVTFVSSVGSFGNYNSTTGVWSVPSIGPYIYGTLIIYATVDAGTGGSTITNTAEITAADQLDPDSTPGNGVTTEDDMASTDIVVNVPIIDLELSKSVTPATANIGDIVMFDIVLTNASATPATGVTITDLLPTGVTVVSFGTSFGTWNPGTGAWTIPSLSPYTYGNLWIFATVDPGAAGSTLTNTAEVTAADQLDVDSTPNNGVTTEDDMASTDLVVNVPIIDLSLTQSVDNPTPNEGDLVGFTVALTNSSTMTATNVSVADLLPVGLTFNTAFTSTGVYDNIAGLWTLGTVSAFAIHTLVIYATVDTGTGSATLTNQAEVRTADQADLDSTVNNGFTGEDDEAVASVTVSGAVSGADLTLTKTIDDSTPSEGQTITYTLTVENFGPADAGSVDVLDNIPAGFTFASATPSVGAYNNGTGIWTVGALPSGGSQVLTLDVTVDFGTVSQTIVNDAEIVASNIFDPDSTPNNADITEDDYAAASALVQGIDLSLSMAVDNATPNEGNTILYTLTQTNASAAGATNIQTRVQLPAGVTYVSHVANGAWDPGTGIWSIASQGPFIFVTMGITCLVDAGTSGSTITQESEIIAVDQTDTDSVPNNGVLAEDDQVQTDIVVQ